MKAAACSWRTITGLILVECLSAIMAPAAFSPAPPKAASTPTLSNALTIASYTRIGRALPSPRGISRRLGQPPSADGGREYRSLGKIQLQIVGCTAYPNAVAVAFILPLESVVGSCIFLKSKRIEDSYAGNEASGRWRARRCRRVTMARCRRRRGAEHSGARPLPVQRRGRRDDRIEFHRRPRQHLHHDERLSRHHLGPSRHRQRAVPRRAAAKRLSRALQSGPVAGSCVANGDGGSEQRGRDYLSVALTRLRKCSCRGFSSGRTIG